MGRNHARVYSELDSAQLVGVADADPAAAAQAGRRFHVPHFTEVGELLDRTQPQVVSVAVPTLLHLPVAREALRRGIHLLIEKPIAYTVEEGAEIIHLAEQAGVVLTVGHVERYNPAIGALKARLTAGDLGRVFQIHARRLGPFPARVRDVGVVIDLATHDVDIMRYLTGADVVRVTAETARRIHTEHEDLLSGLLRFDNDTIGVLDINWLTPTKIRELLVTGERGLFQVNYLTQDLTFYENSTVPADWDALRTITGVSEGAIIRPRIDKIEPLRVELERFVAAASGQPADLVSGRDGLHALAVARALVVAGESGMVVHLDVES
jgi:UDP-N-acetylglucosamine 3-dehydrogenase